MEMMCCIEIGHVHPISSVLIKRSSRAADWWRWAQIVRLPKGFSFHLENGFKIKWDHCMPLACFKLPVLVWGLLNLTAELSQREAKLCLCPLPISCSDPEQNFTNAVTAARQNAAWVSVSWELGCARAAAWNSCCSLVPGSTAALPQCSTDPFVPVLCFPGSVLLNCGGKDVL